MFWVLFSHFYAYVFICIYLSKYLFSFLSESLVIKHKDILTLYHSVWELLIFYESIKVSACQGEEWTFPKLFSSSSGEKVSVFSVVCRLVVSWWAKVWLCYCLRVEIKYDLRRCVYMSAKLRGHRLERVNFTRQLG